MPGCLGSLSGPHLKQPDSSVRGLTHSAAVGEEVWEVAALCPLGPFIGYTRPSARTH